MVKMPPSNDTGDIIGAIIGVPMIVFLAVIWSPYLLLAAIATLFSAGKARGMATKTSHGPPPTDTTKTQEPSALRTFLLVAGCAFVIVFVVLNSGSAGGGGSQGGGISSSPTTTAPVTGAVWVNGYYRQDGTYVQGHYRTTPDSDPSNNWSNAPNVNPYTGKPGRHHPKTRK